MSKKWCVALMASLPLLAAFTASENLNPADLESDIKPVGNAFPTLTHMSETFVVANPLRRQFLGVFGMTNAGGGYPAYEPGSAQALANPTDKVALYAGADCQKGGAPCWTYNSSLIIRKGFADGGGHGATGAEIDINNDDVSTGDGDGYKGAIGNPGYYAMSITGVGLKRVTAAVAVGGPGDRTLFNRGLVILNNSVQQCSICDYGSAAVALDIRGTHDAALDTSRARLAAAIKLANGQNIAALRSDGEGAQLLNIGGDNYVNIAPLGGEGTRIGARGKPILLQGPLVTDLFTPSSSHSACRPGQIANGSDFHYVCVARDRWKRIALSDF